MKENETYQIGEGMPTGPDVAAIRAQWPDIEIGQKIQYEDIEALIGAEWRSSRFKSVTDAWRKRELEDGRVMEVIPGKAFVRINFQTSSGMTPDVFKKVGRKLRKQRQKLSTFKPESEIDKTTRDHQMKLCYVAEREMKKSRMNILPDLSVKQPPQISPPKQIEMAQ